MCLVACVSFCCFICVSLCDCCVGLAALAAVVFFLGGAARGEIGWLDICIACCNCAFSSACRIASSVNG